MIPINLARVQLVHEHVYHGCWFDKFNQRFFNSRWGNTAYFDESTNTAFFISSEQFDHTTPRYYTIRAVNMETGEFLSTDIPELSFQFYNTRAAAIKDLKSLDWKFILS